MINKKYQYAAITGASSGIGRAIAITLAEEGISVALFARRAEKLNELKEIILKKFPDSKVVVYNGDIQIAESVEEFFKLIGNEFGSLDIFVNSAGVVHMGNFARLQPEQVRQIIATNYEGSIWALYYAISMFEKNQKGVLINISSTTASRPYPNASLYASTKSGIDSLVNSLQEEYLNNKRIKILNILPGATYTEFFRDRMDKVNKINMIMPEDIADIVKYYINAPENIKITQVVVRQSGKIL